MSPEESARRLARAKREVANRLQEFVFAGASSEDVADAIEIQTLWLMWNNGTRLRPSEIERMLEATNE